MYVQTVLGKIPSDQLGVCACHEHLYVDLSRIKKDEDTRLQDLDLVIDDLQLFKRLGGQSIIEVTNDGMGRDVPKLQEISRRLNLHIVASTGCYKDPFIPDGRLTWNREQLADWMISEIEEGIEGTGIKPGVIGEIGSSLNEFKPIEIEMFHGAIQAAKQSGLPLSTHTTLGTCALEQVEMFQKENLPLDQVIIGHQDLNTSDGIVLEVLESGAFVALDTIGKTNYRSDEDRLASLIAFIGKGYEDQILLSSDLTRKSHLSAFGGQGYDVVLRAFIPALRREGVTEDVINKLLVKNPQKAFSIHSRKGDLR
ncbi:phosphotriesterase [Fictibacillus sp. 7GRE50]|uniref:phosphotriesterase family protein n=1 Tax=unclassified Fictibacillus TaxID=2644029 RepID=UPI0018CCA372|nr:MULTISPECIES: phosphotriesterase [unclassified Fictibacillus]MBH0164352.1 phosphotriesterase [Fictibacillus sp. 7GRE50]MBH0175555.1 phosphotriesterase [Fictibacillus sp. 23RED33]